MGSPQYLVTDEWSKLLLWSDPSLKQVGVARYVTRDFDVTAPNVAYSAPLEFGISGVPHYIVGFTFDRGYGPPRWGAYLDCYGNGRCAGLTGKKDR